MASAVRSKVLAAVAPLRQSAVGKMAEEQICALPGKLKQGKADWGAHLKALDEAGLIKKKPEEYAKLKEMVSASRKYHMNEKYNAMLTEMGMWKQMVKDYPNMSVAQLANIGIFGAELYLWLNLGEMIGRGSFYGYFVPGMYTAN